MRTDVKKAHLNLSINPDYARLFANLEPIHGMTLSGFLEEKLKELFQEKAPDKLMELEIQETELRLAELKNSLPIIKFTCENLRELHKNAQEQRGQETTQNNDWLEKYNQSKDTMANQVNRKYAEWKKIADNWGFKSAKEAEEKVTEQLKKDNLLGCTVCQKCNTKTMYCSTYRNVMNPYNSCQNWVKA